MKIRKQKRSKKPLIVGAALAVVLAGAGAWWLLGRKPVTSTAATNTSTPTNTVNYNPPTEQERSDQNDQKENILNNQGDTTNQPSVTLNISISRAGQTGAGQPVNVRTVVSGTSTGTCELTFTKGSTSVTKSYPISAAPTSAVCNADVDVSTFNESGSWNLSAIAKSGSSTSAPAVWSLTINK